MSNTAADPAEPLGYQRAFDGMRAIAVLAVIAYHFGVSWAGGGFLGVDVFFVLSGFLITSLLAEEWQATGQIRLGQFYLRRGLRLFPALLLLMVVLNVYSRWWFFPEHVVELRRETVLTLFYMTNWAAVLGVLPSLGFLTHTWSLAIEEQFYLVWPLVLRMAFANLSRSAVLGLLGTLAGASALLRWLLWQGPESFSRIYHASDTRAEALLIGAFVALALPWIPFVSSKAARGLSRMLAAAATVVLLVMLSTAQVHDGALLRGGLSVAALAVALLVIEIRLSPGGLLARVLGFAPLVAIGRISYGLYLWHVPVLLVCTPATTGLGPMPLMAARFAETFAAATLSWFVVERPFLRWKDRLPAMRAKR